MFKKVNAKERIIGWYSSGPRIREADMDIHRRDAPALFATCHVLHPVHFGHTAAPPTLRAASPHPTNDTVTDSFPVPAGSYLASVRCRTPCSSSARCSPRRSGCQSTALPLSTTSGTMARRRANVAEPDSLIIQWLYAHIGDAF